MILICFGAASTAASTAASAAHVKCLTGYMVSRQTAVICTAAAHEAATAVAEHLKCYPQILPSRVDLEVAFLQFFQAPDGEGRDTVVMVADVDSVISSKL